MTDTWTSRWFVHQIDKTFDTDEQAMQSFEEYLKENFIMTPNSIGRVDQVYKKGTDEKVCLMGAEDHYRWKVCHCKECKKAKHTIIIH